MLNKFVGLVACCVSLFSMALPIAHGQQLPEDYQNLELYELDRAADELVPAGFTAADRAAAFANWMAAHDWESLDINSLCNLYEWVSTDSLDPHHFSARWTGFVTAPVTGPYTLTQVRVYKGLDCRLKVVIDGQVILDSGQNLSDDSRFVSQPIQLDAGRPVSIQVELVHVVHSAPPVVDFSESAPMVFLTWKTGAGADTIIPTTAFTPPEGFGEAGGHGLKGQYFGDTRFGALRLTRLDPGLDLIWSWPPVAPIHEPEASAVLAACKEELLNAENLARWAQSRSAIIGYKLWRISYRLTGTERQQLVNILRGQPEVVRIIAPSVMGRLTQAIYMLPSNDQLSLLGEWSLSRPQPRCEAGIFPGYGQGYYQALNTDFYWLIGRFMQGPYANDAVSLWNQYSERPDSECNLSIAYAVNYATRLQGTKDSFMAQLGQQIDNQAVTGNRLLTWLIARAYAQGAIPGNPLPLAGFSDLESALVAAENNDHKFWVVQEMVARLSSVNKGAEAKALIEEQRGDFNSPAQQASIAAWVVKADELAAYYAESRVAQTQENSSAYRSELERRRQQAVERGDSAAASRYTTLLNSAPDATNN